MANRYNRFNLDSNRSFSQSLIMPAPVASTGSAMLRSLAERGVSHWLALYVLPAALLLFSILVWFTLPPQQPETSGTVVPVSVTSRVAPERNPAEALAFLERTPPGVLSAVTDPAWILIPLKPQTLPAGDLGISLHGPLASNMRCWSTPGLEALGFSTRTQQPGAALQPNRRGFSLFLESSGLPEAVLCQAQFIDKGQFYAQVWPEPRLYQQLQRQEHGLSMLEGGLLTIAAFILIIGITTREPVYLVLSLWMIGNLRMGALAMGWDDHWLGRTLPPDWLGHIRHVTLAAYYILTYYLFSHLLPDSRLPRYRHWMQAAQWLGLALLIAALVLPAPVFVPLMWAAAAFGLALTVFMLAVTLIRARSSRVWLWHIVLFGMALCVMLSGALVVLFGRSEFIDIFNGVVALLLSNILVALAVAERMREERRKRIRAQTALVSNYAMIPIGMFTLNPDGTFQTANPVLEQMLGINPEKGDILRWTDFFDDIDWHDLSRRTANDEPLEISLLPQHRRGGSPHSFMLRATFSDGYIVGALQDLVAHKRTIQQLSLLTDTDPLTDTLNRRGIEKAVEEALNDLPNGVPCALAYMNLRHFKRINDLFGHTTGDQVLQQVCDRVTGILGENRTLGRVGGDEFIVLFANTLINDAKRLCASIIEALSIEPFRVGDRAFQINAVMGIISLQRSMTGNEAISAASHACRDARRRNQEIVLYDDSLALQEHTEELRLFDQIEGGESPSGLYLDMQPIVALKDPLRSLNFEVLLRVRDPSGAPVPSGKFITSAEESGTMSTLDKWVFTATLEWMDKHHDKLARTQFVNVNLSGVSLNNEKFQKSLFELLSRYQHVCSKLYIEITEGVALQNLELTRQFMAQLNSLGVRVALDDFGAGYTSFSYLKELPAQAIKIDGTLIRDMLVSDTNTAIVRAIVQLAQSMNKQCIAEWVEDYDTLIALRDMGVDYVQGFIISKARSPADILNARSINDLVSSSMVRDLLRNS